MVTKIIETLHTLLSLDNVTKIELSIHPLGYIVFKDRKILFIWSEAFRKEIREGWAKQCKHTQASLQGSTRNKEMHKMVHSLQYHEENKSRKSRQSTPRTTSKSGRNRAPTPAEFVRPTSQTSQRIQYWNDGDNLPDEVPSDM